MLISSGSAIAMTAWLRTSYYGGIIVAVAIIMVRGDSREDEQEGRDPRQMDVEQHLYRPRCPRSTTGLVHVPRRINSINRRR